MSNNRGSRSLRRRPSDKKPAFASEKKMRSLQSLQERFCFTLKKPRTNRARPFKGGPNSFLQHNYEGKSSVMENGLIQIPHVHCDFYYETLSLSSSYVHLSASSSSTSSASSSITQVGLAFSPISSSENSSEDGFSSDEVMSLMGCSDFIKENVLDFMPSALESHGIEKRPDACEPIVAEADRSKVCCGSGIDSIKEECCSSVEDDGEPYRIDLCDFEPDVGAMSGCASEQQEEGGTHLKRYGGEVLCLRLDYEEVLRAWKERGEYFIAKEPSNYPSPYLDPLHTYNHASFVPHPSYH